jgi:alanine dehydrogenase
MIIGIPREIKRHEYRVGMTPAGVRQLCAAGHQLLVETGAGSGSGISDPQYVDAGAGILQTAAEIYAAAEMIVKVKEPLPAEYELLRPQQILFTYLHLAAVPELADLLVERRVTAIAYETIETADQRLPLLQPMSEIAGRMSVQVGAHFLEKEHGGRGVLLSGAPGVRQGRVAILGGGTVGGNALRIAIGMGAEVTLLDVNIARLAQLDEQYGNRIHTLAANSQNIEAVVRRCDLLIGAVLLPGGRAPRLVSRELVGEMHEGAVIVDVAVDQGGCVESIHPTTHDKPTYVVDGVIHYGVANMPGAVARTSTFALTNSTLVYIEELAQKGVAQACREDAAFARGLNAYDGKLRHRAVAESLGRDWRECHF